MFSIPSSATGSIRATVYLRVSRTDQSEDLQADGIEQLIRQRGWTVVQTFTDHGVSGSREKRPGLDAVLAAALEGLNLPRFGGQRELCRKRFEL